MPRPANIAFRRLVHGALLLLITAAATVWLRLAIEPWLPPGECQEKLTFLFAIVLWPQLAWSLRSLTRIDPADPCSMLWWW